MPTWLISSFFLSNVLAICAGLWAISRSLRLSAELARLQSQLSELERSERLTPSRLAQLAEVNESLNRAEELLAKVNRREIARAKARSEDGTYAAPVAGTIKDQLRLKAGLRAGQPALHS